MWLLVWPATAAATLRLEALPEPVLPDLAARELERMPLRFDSADTRLEAATLGLRIGEQQWVLGRIEQASVSTVGGARVIGGFELAYRHDLLAGPLRPFASAGLGWIGRSWAPSSSRVVDDAEPQVRVVVGLDLALRRGWSAEAIVPVRWLATSDRTFAAATLGLRKTFE